MSAPVSSVAPPPVAPSWECSWGVFAAECPELGGRVGGTVWDTPAKSSGG
ncbi:MAG: hypothetical protein WKF43_02065 [Acidimicrobiales bacterium]